MTTEDDHKAHLLRALTAAREALLWKLDGLSEREVRWPVVPTGTNLLGLVKHLASVEAGYLGDVFGRPSPEHLPWFEDGAEPNADMWAPADESRASVLGLYERVRAHSEATVAALPLDAAGVVPWWAPGKRDVTLHQILVHPPRRPPRGDPSGGGLCRGAPGRASAEQAAAEEGALERVVAVHATAAEAGDLARGVQPRDRRAVEPERP